MENKNSYITILMESLRKKSTILDEILCKNAEQREILTGQELDEAALQSNMEEKEHWIKELTLLDRGFNSIYEKVKEDLLNHKEKYALEIKCMQTLIKEITDKSMDIQVGEKRNRDLMAAHYSRMRTKIRQAKVGKDVATNYYKTMNNLDFSTPQFLDKKK